ncbi:MAG: efflux RND transporter periplasmic adaptor subunit [Betaproteobacteria bacterium]|nr:efflux RND transporter periplasmic adaptor subunit [Betaproteobacteria bacterium]
MKVRNLIFALAAAGVLGAAGYGLYGVGMNQGMNMAAPRTESASTPDGGPQKAGDIDPATGKKVLCGHDPMVPGKKFDQPGKSPFMDMQLVPVYAGAEADEGKITISPRVQQNLGVRTAEVIKGALSPAVEAVGNVVYNERDVAVVQARTNGYVEKLYVRAPLDPVKKGQPLAEIYAPDWVATQEEYLSLKRMSGAGLDALTDGARQRMRLAGMTDDHIRLVESTGKLHPRLTVTAPVGGVVSELGTREGMTVMSGAALFRINGLGTVWVNAEVPESQAGLVRPGNAVEARTPALPGAVFKGRVNAILPEVNAATRTLKARVELANPGAKLVPGMFATVNFTSVARKEILLVPSEAVIQTGRRSVVIVTQGDSRFAAVDVEVGMESNGQMEIRKGLEAGQKIVVSGQFLIDSEASLKAATTRMGDMPTPEAEKDGMQGKKK